MHGFTPWAIAEWVDGTLADLSPDGLGTRAVLRESGSPGLGTEKRQVVCCNVGAGGNPAASAAAHAIAATGAAGSSTGSAYAAAMPQQRSKEEAD